MIKWPWKSNDASRNMALPWDEALAIPVLANLPPDEQSKLIQLADRFLQQKRLVALQGFELDALKSTRIALLFCLPVLELGIEWLDGFHEVLSILHRLWWMTNGRTISALCTTSA